MARQDTTEAFEALKQYMVENYNAKIVSGGREIVKRCHFCGDSRDLSNAHLYIGMRDGQIVYNCFKCNAKGIVDGKFLRDLGAYDQNLTILLQEQNRNNSVPRYSKSNRSGIRVGENPYSMLIFDDEYAMKKLDYISRRMGIIFNPHDVARLKIVLNPLQYLNRIGVKYFTRDPALMDLIDKFFLGFLSIDNRYIILRRLVPEGKLPEAIDHRYINYNIYNNNYGYKYYSIPRGVDFTQPINIHIAEGAFDILSVCFNTGYIDDNAMYFAICGKGYRNLARDIVTNFGMLAFNLHIYIDSNVPDKDLMSIAEDLKPFANSIYLHRNAFEGEEDFGVPGDRIIDSYRQIL